MLRTNSLFDGLLRWKERWLHVAPVTWLYETGKCCWSW